MVSANLPRVLIALRLPRDQTRACTVAKQRALSLLIMLNIRACLPCCSGLPETIKKGAKSEEATAGAIGPGGQEAYTVGGGSQSYGCILGASQSDYRYVSKQHSLEIFIRLDLLCHLNGKKKRGNHLLSRITRIIREETFCNIFWVAPRSNVRACEARRIGRERRGAHATIVANGRVFLGLLALVVSCSVKSLGGHR